MAPPPLNKILLTLTTILACSRGASPSADGGTDDRVVAVDPRAAVCPASDAATAPVTYLQMQQIFDDNCVSCHDVDGGLVLTAPHSWSDLVNQPAPDPDTCGGILVAPGNASGSYLYEKLSSASPCYGTQMPMGEFFPDPLPACVIAMVEAWIAEGAPAPVADGGGD